MVPGGLGSCEIDIVTHSGDAVEVVSTALLDRNICSAFY